MLPSEYQQVEYIEQTGTQWIDTGIVPTSDLVAQITLMNIEATGDLIFGFWNTEYTSYRFFNPYGGDRYFDTPTGQASTYRANGGTFPAGIKKQIELANHYVKDLETGIIGPIKDPAPFIEVSKTITLGYYNDAKISKNRWYEVQMSNDNGKLFHGIPCYRKSDSEPGMYDLVTGAFFVNQGVDEFVVGPDVIDSISPWLIARRRMLMKAPPKPLYNWNLKSSLVDAVSGVQATTNGTITADGLSFVGGAKYAEFPGIFNFDKTYVVKVGRIAIPLNNQLFARLLMVDADPNTSAGGSGFVLAGRTGRNGDRFYIFPAWDQTNLISGDPDGSYFDGTTFALYFASNRIAYAYRNGVLIGNSERTFNNVVGSNIYIGSNTTDDNFGDGLILGLTVYDGNIYQ